MSQVLFILLAAAIGALSTGIALHFVHEAKLRAAVSDALASVPAKRFGLKEANAVMAMAPKAGMGQETLLWFRETVRGILGYKFTVAEDAKLEQFHLDVKMDRERKNIDSRLSTINALRQEIEQLLVSNESSGRNINAIQLTKDQLETLVSFVDPQDEVGGVEVDV